MPARKQRFVIIDGNALIHRAFHALPPLTTKKGEIVNAVFGFASVLLKVLKELKPDYVAATFDPPGKTFRHQDFPAYKAQRIKPPQELYDQIPRVKELVAAFRIPAFEKPGYEADDVIGTLTNKAKDVEKVIVTGDMDTLQLVDDETRVYTLKKGIGETVLYDRPAVQERFGLTPEQLIDFKALRGDPSDNIPGVPGVGDKTAADLLQTFGTVEELYQALKKKSAKAQTIPEGLREKLLSHQKDVQLSKKLVTIVRSVPVTFDLAKTARSRYDRQRVVDLFRELEFQSLLSRLPPDEAQRQAELELKTQATVPKRKGQRYELVRTREEWDTLERELKAVTRLAVDTETSDLDPFTAQLLGVSLAWKPGQASFISLRGELTPDLLKPFLEDRKVEKVGHNSKFDLEVLRQHGIELQPLVFDTMIASYLLHAGTRQHNLDAAVFTEFGYEMMPIEALIGPKGKKQLPMRSVPEEKLSWYSCEDADFTLRLSEAYRPKLTAEHLDRVFRQIEIPLLPVLADMEAAGVAIDADLLESLSKTLGRKLEQLEARITKLAGTSFNINSPGQLKVVLFEKLQLESKGLGRTKTGISTSAEELEKLKGSHPIIPLIIEYREYQKLKSTYLDALPQLVSQRDGRLHTSFNQTVAATGRLSSSEPNLQNIPIRTEWGQKIRQAFVALPHFKLLSADYSQIELRIAASLANDTKMLEAFEKGEDIHSRTAAEVHGVPLGKVSPTQRYSAKAINFGIIYGLGSVGLSQSTGMTRDEARAFIEKYLTIYRGIANYIEETKALAHKLGYSETLFGRRRKLPEINSNQPMLRSQAERMAINMPIQGTQADIIKMAMVAVSRGLPSVSPKARMILQVHDELLFEVPEDDVRKVGKFVKETMEGIHKFKAPLIVEIHAGANWDEAH